jgi:hypothetical protein
MSKALFSSEPEVKAPGQVHPPKVFAQPFRLAFKHEEDEAVASWIEVRSLSGLRGVFEKLASGELEEINRFCTVEMQLWGHLAEHTGFLRTRGATSMLSAGIQPAGEGLAPLTEDLSELMGGDDITALQVLDAMRANIKTRNMDTGPIEHERATYEFVKEDGVNLTEEGENALHELVYGGNGYPDRHPEENVAFRKESENAVQIFRSTPDATPEEIEQEAKERVECLKASDAPEGPVVTGEKAAKVGRLVAAAVKGEGDSAADERVQAEAEAAEEIMKKMLGGSNPRHLPPSSVPALGNMSTNDARKLIETRIMFLMQNLLDPTARDEIAKLQKFLVEIQRAELNSATKDLTVEDMDLLLAKAEARDTVLIPGCGFTMHDAKELTDKAWKVTKVSYRRGSPMQSRLEPREAAEAQDANLKKVMDNVGESDLVKLVEDSPAEPKSNDSEDDS